ncbi:S-adenosylmethionine carrier 1 [Cucumis melo var. makuwa]|uniref:S-adenosylmethionine carrier 1 n=1 Tax=Cucumis melo var. makuwa TaxID=1194695 RepID=A0A5A7TTR3_CUCMM|nr:S-adenosylmethionine carrier 1 [Cucumis melo var. makuwa]
MLLLFVKYIPIDHQIVFLGLVCNTEGAIAGSVASFVIEAALYPIDTIKTRLQAVHGGGKIVLKGLYSGLTGNLVGMLPATAIFVGVYEPTKQTLLNSLPENLNALAHLTAGVVGGVASSIIRVPTEVVNFSCSITIFCPCLLSSLFVYCFQVVKQRMQTSHFASASNAVQAIVSREGFKGLYAGYGSFLLRDLPFDAIQFCIYEQLRIGYKLAAQRDPNDPENALIGAFSGAVTGAITTPFDVIKTRLMVQGSNSQYQGIRDCCRTIMKEEGARAFLKGMGPRVLWIGLGGAIFFGVLEKTKQMLANQRHPLPEKPIQSQ